MDMETLDISQGDGVPIAVPSGQVVTLLDIIWNSEGPDGPTPRFRFVAPGIARVGGSVDFATAEGDLQHLCDGFARGHLAQRGLDVPLVLLSMADRALEFGMSDPDATQYVEAFLVQGPTCVREIF